MIVLAGLLASVLFLSGLIHQIAKIHSRKMAEDLSLSTYSSMFFGFVLILYVAIKTDAHWTFTFGAGLQGLVTLYMMFLIHHFQKEQNIRMKVMRDKIMKEARKYVVKGGKSN